MGYYITAWGQVTMPRSVEGAALDALKALNHRHDLKNGGRHPKTGDPFEDSWYSWMPPKYHEDPEIVWVSQILEMLGFEVDTHGVGENLVFTLNYDNKTGQEDLFLDVLADYADITVVVSGEDGEAWKWENGGIGRPLRIIPKEYDESGAVLVRDILKHRQELSASIQRRV